MNLNRRHFLQGAGLVSALALLSTRSENIFAAAAVELGQPKQIKSASKVLNVTLIAAATMIPFNGGKRYALTYNGNVPAPTLVARPGDTLKIKLVNKLNYPTNLHTHGLRVSPSGNSDNPMLMVMPGKSFDYEIKIPTSQRSGTFWYHPHHHEFVANQVHAGLTGAIIIEDAIDEQPTFTAAESKILMFSDPRIGENASVLDTSMMDQMHGRSGSYVLINGQLNPKITQSKSGSERWRLINSSPSRYLTLTIPDADISVLATDGGRLETPIKATSITMTPGQRFEIVVTPKKSGAISLLNDGKSIATITSGSIKPFDFSKSQLGSVPTLKPTGSRTLTIVGAGGMGMMGGNAHEMSFTFDGKPFDHNVINQKVKFGSVEDWTIKNTSSMDHPFHIHAWDFQVINNGYGKALPGWKDTVNVPAGKNVTIRINFVDIKGTTVYHCHILDHEDGGMMGLVQVS